MNVKKIFFSSKNTFTATPGLGTYQWINCNDFMPITETNTNIYKATASGNYAVVVTSPTGCTDNSECVNLIIQSSINQLLDPTIMIIPNPEVDFIYFNINKPLFIKDITIFNYCGDIVFSRQAVNNNSFELNIGNLPAGLYSALISTSEGVILKTILKL